VNVSGRIIRAAMESWSKVTLSDADIIASKDIALENEFEALFVANHRPKNAAMFENLEWTLGQQFYFSPGGVMIAKILIQNYAGIECPPPSLAPLSLRVGNAGWRTTFFPEPSSS
jgi:hypothetical protein